MAEKCPCQTYVTSCCACVSMHCDECHGHSKFVQGRFCSNCGRPLKAELTRLYVPKSEVERLRKALDEYEETSGLKQAKSDVAREIFAEIKQQLRGLFDFFRQDDGIRESGAIMLAISEIAELEKKYMEGCDGK